MLLLLLVVSITRLIAAHLLLHVLVGILVLPPLLLKFASTGYRFARYYLNEPSYRAAGRPDVGHAVTGSGAQRR